MNTSDVLNKAADLIEKRGWISADGWAEDEHSPLCLEGGLIAALGGSMHSVLGFRDAEVEFRNCPAYQAVRNYVTFRDGDSKLWHWNDELDRTATEVIATLRAAALIEAAKENADTGAQVTA